MTMHRHAPNQLIQLMQSELEKLESEHRIWRQQGVQLGLRIENANMLLDQFRSELANRETEQTEVNPC